MATPFFQFKQFTINQDKCAMKVGTDGVLLGAWVNCTDAKSILDIGTGTGLIALMLAQRSEAQIDAVEYDTDAAQQAQENVAASPFKDRINVFPVPFQEFEPQDNKRYDLIVTNPPFFNNSLKPPKENRSIARHGDTLNFTEILVGSKHLLNPQGKLSVILPLKEAEDFMDIAEEMGFFLVGQCHVMPHPEAKARRMLLTLALKKATCKKSQLQIETNVRHQYSPEFKALTAEFYLDKTK